MKTSVEMAIWSSMSFYHMINDDNIDKIYNSTATDISGDLELYYSIQFEMPREIFLDSINAAVPDEQAEDCSLHSSVIFAVERDGQKTVHQMHVLVEVVDGKEVMRVDNIMADVPADDRVRSSST